MTTSARSPLAVDDVSVVSDPRWADLVLAHRSDVFHSPRWARVLEQSYGFDVRAKVVVDDTGRAVAGIAYVDVDDARGRRLVSLPFSDFCDPLVSEASHWGALAAALPLADVPMNVRCLRHTIVADGAPWSETASFAWHRVDAARSDDDAWSAIDSGARRAIRKARASGVDVTPADSEADLRAFFEMHLRVRKLKYGLLAQPYRFFEAIWEHFLSPGHGVLLLARSGGDVVGGVLYLEWGDTLYYKFNASAPSDLGVRPNDLLAWEGLAFARARGLRWLDFGVSDWDQEGLVRYKRKYATEESVVRKYSVGTAAPDNLGAVLGGITEVLVDPAVPDSATERAGDLLYAFFC